MQRHDVASTLRRRCIKVMCLLGWFWCCLFLVAARCGLFFFPISFQCFVLFIILLSFLMDSVWHCDHLVGEVGPGSFDFLRFVVNVLSVNLIFHISAQNIDCGYSLEPPWRGSAQNIDCGYSLEPPR